MKKVILAEYFPRENIVSRIMYSFDERNDLYYEFASMNDAYKESIALMLDYDGKDKTFEEITELCRKALHKMTKEPEE